MGKIKRGDTVKRVDGKQISYLLPNSGMTAPVAIEPGGMWGTYGWHYVKEASERIPGDMIGLKIGLFPTFEKACEYEPIMKGEKDG